MKPGKLEKCIAEETVILADVTNDEPKKASLIVQRSDGKRYTASFNGKNIIDTEWVVGEKYELKNIELRSRTKTTDRGRFLKSGKETSVRRVTRNSFDLLVLGDTHFGYHNRPDENRSIYDNRPGEKDSRYSDGDEFRVLELVKEISEDWGVDGILQTGDLFDHGIEDSGYSEVESTFQKLNKSDVDIFFIAGNHDEDVKSRLSSITKLDNVKRLDKTANWGSVGGINIVGQGHNDFSRLADFDWLEFEREYGGPNLLLCYPENVDNKCPGFRQLSEKLNEEWIVFLGHSHDEDTFKLNGFNAFFTGFPAKLCDGGTFWRVQGGHGYYDITSHSFDYWQRQYPHLF